MSSARTHGFHFCENVVAGLFQAIAHFFMPDLFMRVWTLSFALYGAVFATLNAVWYFRAREDEQVSA